MDGKPSVEEEWTSQRVRRAIAVNDNTKRQPLEFGLKSAFWLLPISHFDLTDNSMSDLASGVEADAVVF
jgi:hypothetical protein